ncbi:MAG: hypothetical protein CMG66_03345 [Candidatus Marinimicrobia bacterium]|nr:hypothetical protein [Candidatus Neomarinimicrobiota bacterium]|tara:strand:- start:15431 stop:16402 length:972 start_codon:yes stop_codon:yes gene_type:complete
MKLIQLYKIVILLILFPVSLFCDAIKPNSAKNENKINLVIDTSKGKKQRAYYLVDDDGLLFKTKDFLKQGFRNGDRLNFQIMSRTYLASSNDNRKKFQFHLIIKKKGQIIVDRELTYNKKVSSATSPEDKKGFSFTYSGYWFEDLKLTKDLEIYIKPIDGMEQKVYARLIARKNYKSTKTKKRIFPVDYQKNITVSESGKNQKRDWYLLTSDNKQQFKLDPNGRYQVLTRLVLGNKVLDEQQYYKLIAYENNQKLGSYIMEGNPSLTNAIIEKSSKNLKGKLLSKYSSFFISVPDNNEKYSYYTFKLPKEDDSKVLIKILEYE